MPITRKSPGKIVRRLGVNIFENPKFDALLQRKPSPPGQNTNKRRRKKMSEFSRQLIEKQKIRFAYGVSERQFVHIYKKAKQMEGVTGSNMLVLLERRLDNVLFRLGFAATRAQARQSVVHGHILVNNKRVDIPSFQLKPNDVISVAKKEKSKELISRQIEKNPRPFSAEWLALDKESIMGAVMRIPKREDIPFECDEQAVVEFYAK